MSAATDVEQVRQSIAVGGIGFGALAVATPGLFSGLYGLEGDGNLRAMVQLWGVRNVALGAIGLMTEDVDQRRTLATVTAAISVADTVIIARSGSDVSARARVGGILTTAAFAAASVYVARNL